jgi:hypothetical protein
VAQQVDWHLVRAEMNGLDFDHRVLRPWTNDAAFCVTVFPSQSDQPTREGPLAFGAVELWTYRFPLAGMFDARPRTRELLHVLAAQRAARGLGDLRMHAVQATLEEAARFASANTPRGWLRVDGSLVRAEQQHYLEQPAWQAVPLAGRLLRTAPTVSDNGRFCESG